MGAPLAISLEGALSDRSAQEIEAAFSEIRRASTTLASGSKDPELLLKVATILDYENQSRKTLADLRSLGRTERTETLRFFVPIIAPLVSAIAVVAALVFQTFQFRANTKLQETTVEIQRDTARIQARAAEDAEWRQVATTISTGASTLTGMTGTAMLLPFIKQGSHTEEARTLATYLLSNTIDYDGFSSLFKTLLDATPTSQRLGLSIHLAQMLNGAWSQAEEHKKSVVGPVNEVLYTLPDEKGQQVPNPYWISAQVNRQVTLVATAIADSLRSGMVTSDQQIDLSKCALWDTNWSGVKFPRSDISFSSFANTDLTDADLSRVFAFDRSYWPNTAWWRAKRIQPALLKYLRESFPFKAQNAYAGSPPTKDEYESQLARLTRDQ
jgi:hypothetical protein